MTADTPELRQTDYGSTHSIQTTDPRDFLQFLRNSCRKLGYKTVTDTLEITKERGELGSIDGEIVVEKSQKGEIRTESPMLGQTLKFTLAASSVLLLLVSAFFHPLLIPGILLGLTSAGLWYVDTEQTELKTFPSRLRIQVDGDTQRSSDISRQNPRQANITWHITVETVAKSPYPDVATEMLQNDISELSEEIENYHK